MKKNLVILGIAIVILILGVLAVSKKTQTPNSEKIKVSASFYPLGYFAERIGGARADVFTVTPAGAEPHDYEPSAQDVARISDSSILILNGGGLEAWADGVEKNLDPAKTNVVVAGKDLATKTKKENGQTIADPHFWLSPVLATKITENILVAFIKADPAHAAYYSANEEALKADLASLDSDFRSELSNCTQRSFVTSHAAFGYLSAQYGLRQTPIAGLSPDAEPSPRQMSDVVSFIKKNAVKYVFFESLVSPKLSQTIATESGAQTLVLDPIEGLTPNDISAGKDYLTVMRANLNNLKIALECK